jgi:hypothetical protein
MSDKSLLYVDLMLAIVAWYHFSAAVGLSVLYTLEAATPGVDS